MRDLLLVLFLFVAIFYAFKRPYLGVAAWVWIALTAPAKWTFGFSQDFRLNLTIVVVTAISYLFVTRNKDIKVNGLGVWVFLFGFWTLVTTSVNLNTDPAMVWDYWNQFIKVLLLFFFITLAVRRRLHIETLIWAIVLSVSSYAAMEAVKFLLSGGGHNIAGRAGIIADRNDLAVAINMCIPLVAYLIQVTQHKTVRMVLWGILLLNLVSVVGTGSRGGFIGLAILAVAFWLRSHYKVQLAILALLALPVMYQATPEEWRERQATIATASEEDSSFIGRLWAWKISTLLALDHPLTGGGFKAVLDGRVWKYYAPLTPNFTFLETPPLPQESRSKAAHNIYFQVLGDHGFVGLFIFLMMLAVGFLNNRHNARLSQAHADWYHKLAGFLALSLIGYGITGANVSLAYFDLLYTVLGIIAVMTLRRSELLKSESTPIESTSGHPGAGGRAYPQRRPKRRAAASSAGERI